MNIPNDLIPLPTMPYDERPVSLPLDVEECRTALWKARGNVTEAATYLKITAARLRSFVSKSAYLTAEQQEAKDQMVDKAERVVLDALDDYEDKGRQDTMARFVLGNIGRHRGWGTGGSGGNLNIKNKGGTIIVRWADGSVLGEAEQTIELTANDEEEGQQSA